MANEFKHHEQFNPIDITICHYSNLAYHLLSYLSMKTRMTAYREMIATLTAYELDGSALSLKKELKQGTFGGPAMKRHEQLIREYWRAVTGEKE